MRPNRAKFFFFELCHTIDLSIAQKSNNLNTRGKIRIKQPMDKSFTVGRNNYLSVRFYLSSQHAS